MGSLSRASVLLLALAIGYACDPPARTVEPTLAAAIEHRGRVAFAYAPLEEAAGVEPIRVAANSPIDEALTAAAPDALARALGEAGIRTLVVGRGGTPSSGSSLRARIARREAVPGFRYRLIGPAESVLEPLALPSLTEAERSALARIARQVLAGSEPPRLGQFPRGLRAPYAGEVLLEVVRASGQRALWRSARSSSLAAGVLSATHEAAARWAAREANLGGPMSSLLRTATVRVSVLIDDGTFAERDRAFLDAALTDDHGPAIDRVRSWHYLLPDAESRRGKPGSQAFAALLADNRLPSDALDRPDVRVYRVRVEPLSISVPP